MLQSSEFSTMDSSSITSTGSKAQESFAYPYTQRLYIAFGNGYIYKCINAHRCYILTSYIGCILHFNETLIILIHNVKRLIFTFTQNHTLYSTPLPPNTVCKSVLKEKILNYRPCQEVWPSYTEWLTSLTQKNNFTPVSLCSAERRSRKIADTLRAIHTRAWHW